MTSAPHTPPVPPENLDWEAAIKTACNEFNVLQAEISTANTVIASILGFVAVGASFIVQQRVLADGWMIAFVTFALGCMTSLTLAIVPRNKRRRSRVSVLLSIRENPEGFFKYKVSQIKAVEEILQRKYHFVKLGFSLAALAILVMAVRIR